MSESVTVSEGGGSVELCLRLSVPLASPLTVPLIFGTTGTTATSGIAIAPLSENLHRAAL